MDSQAVVQPSSINTFRPKVLNFNLPKGADHRSAVFPLVSKENNALRLAESARFDEMCAKILWGSEDPEVFGEFLRSLVVNFQPENVFELTLLRKIAELSEVIDKAAVQLAPHGLAFYAMDLAGVFHAFYRDCRVISSDPADAALSCARLRLVAATKAVFTHVLGLMGVNAPESM